MKLQICTNSKTVVVLGNEPVSLEAVKEFISFIPESDSFSIINNQEVIPQSDNFPCQTLGNYAKDKRLGYQL